MNNLIPEEWLPRMPNQGPPLPRSMGVYWPWYTPPEVPPEAPIYACPYCTAEFATEAELFAHIASAHPAQPPQVVYGCPICGARFDTMSELTDHMARVHPPVPPKVFTCPHCGAQFSTEAELSYHVQLVHPTVPPIVFTCTICGATFATQAELDYHIATAHPEVPPAPPEVADIKDFDFKLTKGTYNIGDKVPFTAPYDYKGIAQDGQLTISIGTGVYPSFFTKHTFAPIRVRFEAAADWETRGLNGNITLPDVLEPGQTYSVRARLETLTVKTQETDTDWSAFDIKAKPPLPPEEALYATKMRVVATPLDTKFYRVTFSADITNRSSQPVDAQLIWGTNYGLAEAPKGLGWEEEASRIVTIQPGETYHWAYEWDGDIEYYYKGYLRCQLYVDGTLLSEGKWL